MAEEVPDWFRNAVIDGVSFLYSLALRGAPSAEVVPLTTTGWIDILWRRPGRWIEELDAPRLGPAFVALAGAVDVWPAPRALLEHLPPRQDTGAVLLPAPAPSADQRARLAALRRRVRDHLTGAARPSTPPLRTYFSGNPSPSIDGGRNAPCSGKLGGASVDAAPETATDAAGATLGWQ